MEKFRKERYFRKRGEAKVDSNSSIYIAQRNCKRASIFRIVPLRLYGNDTQVDTYTDPDDGSGVSLWEERLDN